MGPFLQFNYHHDGAVRDEIEAEIQTEKKNDSLAGSITPIKAKYLIYIKGLGFEDYSNFNGVMINFNGIYSFCNCNKFKPLKLPLIGPESQDV